RRGGAVMLARAMIACAIVLWSTIAAADGTRVSYAIVIGNNAPPRAGTAEVLQPLRYADDDAVRYYQLFSRFADTRLLVVPDATTQKRYPDIAAHAMLPRLDNLKAVVTDLASRMQRDRARGDLPVLYFAFS